LRNNFIDAGSVEITQNEFGPVPKYTRCTFDESFFSQSSLEVGEDQRRFFADP
jgi:hypothetical protein